jgi:hypothetical protein
MILRKGLLPVTELPATEGTTDVPNRQTKSGGSCLMLSIIGWTLASVSLWLFHKMFSMPGDFGVIWGGPGVLAGFAACILHLIAFIVALLIHDNPEKAFWAPDLIGFVSSIVFHLIIAYYFLRFFF